MRTMLGVVLVAMFIVLFFPVHATISTTLSVSGDGGQMRIIENSKQGLIDITLSGNTSLITTKSVTEKSTEGAAEVMAENAKFTLKTPEYCATISGEDANFSAVYGFSLKPKEIPVMDDQGNSSTIFSTTINEAQAAISLDASVFNNATMRERISVPYKGRPLTITDITQSGGGLIINRTLELSGEDVW